MRKLKGYSLIALFFAILIGLVILGLSNPKILFLDNYPFFAVCIAFALIFLLIGILLGGVKYLD